MVLRRQQSNCSTPPHNVPWGQEHILCSGNSVKERYSRPCLHEEDQRSDTNTLVPAVLENKVQAPTCRRTSPILTFSRQQKDAPILRKNKIIKYWHESGTEEVGLKTTFILILPIILLSFPLFPLSAPNLSSLPEFFHLYFLFL